MLINTYPPKSRRQMYLLLALAGVAVLLSGLAVSQLGRQLPAPWQQPAAPAVRLPEQGKLPISFEPNVGQTNGAAHYMAHTAAGIIYFTRQEVVLKLKPAAAGAAGTDRVRIEFLGASAGTIVEAGEGLPGKVNYILGDNPAEWYTNLPTYAGINYRGLYPGIDLSYSGVGGNLKSTYVVAPGADPDGIRWLYRDARKVSLDSAGNLQVVLAGNSTADLVEQAPVAWQEVEGERRSVSVGYQVAADGSIGFTLGSYDRSQPLIIDPALVLAYSSYLGGGAGDEGRAIAVLGTHAFITGLTESTDFPARTPEPTYTPLPSYTPNPTYNPLANSGMRDVFVARVETTAAGEASLVYATYLGGSLNDEGNGIAVDSQGNAYVAGSTDSPNFPLQNPQQIDQPGRDAFVSKLDPSGSALLYSTYLGGGGNDAGRAIDADEAGMAYVAGDTTSNNFPLANQYQGDQLLDDAFVARLDTTAERGASLRYSTYLGGLFIEQGTGIAADEAGSAFVTGFTVSPNFPTRNQYQGPTTSTSAFVTRFNTTLAGDASLIYSTYLGGAGDEAANGIAWETGGIVYVTGVTSSGDFPQLNALHPLQGGGDAFLSRLNTAAAGPASLLYSTYLGGSASDIGYAVASAGNGVALVAGTTSSANFPTQNQLYGPQLGADAFVTKLNTTSGGLASLVFSTYLGGLNNDIARGVAADATGAAYVAGLTDSTNFPTQNQYQADQGGTDAFVAKLAETGAGATNTPVSTIVPTSTPLRTSTPQPTFTQPSTSTPLPTYTPLPTFTTLPTYTPLPTHTSPAGATPTTTSTPCAIQFVDVPPGDPFYSSIRCLACRGIVSGYADRTFRPGNDLTRGQAAKIVSGAAGFNEAIPSNQQTFQDVPPSSPFWVWIERLSSRGIIAGYNCGRPGEPCETGNRPYFRWAANVTRGQLSKIVSEAADFNEAIPSNQQTFQDVPPSNPFWVWIERLSSRGIIAGYNCGGPGEPCGTGNRPYFRWAANVTRAQTTKIVAGAFFPECQTPLRQ